MSNSVWHYAQNQFESSTRGSFKRMNTISADHDSKLGAQVADAEIQTLYDFYHPLHLDYTTKYQSWLTSSALYRGATLSFENKLAELGGDTIENFDIRIQVKYKRDSPEYIALLPNYRKPFQTGTYESRLAALGSLAEAIGTDADLADVKTEIETFHTEALALRNTQQGKEGLVAQKSSDLEEARIAAAEGMYYTLAGLMQKFYQDRSEIERFYDLALIRDTGGSADEPEIVEGTVAAGTTETTVAGPYEAPNGLTLVNTGTVPLTFCETTDAEAACTTGFVLNPGESMNQETFSLAEGAFLNVTNTGTVEGSWQVTIW